MDEKFNPVYLDKQLGELWTMGETRDAQDQHIELCAQIDRYWTALAEKIWGFYDSKRYPLYFHFVSYLIHDGNRSNSLLRSYIKDYEKGAYHSPWYALGQMYHYIWQAEIFMLMVQKGNVKK